MDKILDLERFPLDRPECHDYTKLVARCQDELGSSGMFNLVGFLRAGVAQACADALTEPMASASFTHKRSHNIYFKKSLPDLPADHPTLREFDTINHTLCADQLGGNAVMDIYQWAPLAAFLARVLGKNTLHQMEDKLARVNVMEYRQGEALNWHFDRAEFTTTLLLQASEKGGEFEYSTNLRSENDPNYDGVAKLLNGQSKNISKINPVAGTLNVFRGINTPHRVTPIEGERARVIAVYSYFDRPGVVFNSSEQSGFYGRRK